MPILAHNEQLFSLKKTSNNAYEIYLIKHYHFSIINSIIILRLKLFKLTHCNSTRKLRVQPLVRETVKNVIRDGTLEYLRKPSHIIDIGSIIC